MYAMSDSLPTTGLLWFRHDLRLHDNPALWQLTQRCQQLACIYVVDPRWRDPGPFGCCPLGPHRARFLLDSLEDLHQQLQRRGQSLWLLCAEPVEALRQLCQLRPMDLLGCNHHPGAYEQQQYRHLLDQRPSGCLLGDAAHTLFSRQQLPFALPSLPVSFTPFRQQVEQHPLPDTVLSAPVHWPEPLSLSSLAQPFQRERLARWLKLEEEEDHSPFQGGATAAQAQLHEYLFGRQQVRHYKQTRNELCGWSNSSRLSPWLANGCLSARQVLAALHQHEERYGRNDSTYWLSFELLWREYFQWVLEQHGARLFAFSGQQGKTPTGGHHPLRFQQWCRGETPYPLVNACMNELRHTGWLSNRGRQLVASCLVNELQLDWRYGAAWFEQQLLDFDVASNWGNWQYLAGVGNDPRGQRHFNLAKQAERYDPLQHYQQRWLGGALDPESG